MIALLLLACGDPEPLPAPTEPPAAVASLEDGATVGARSPALRLFGSLDRATLAGRIAEPVTGDAARALLTLDGAPVGWLVSGPSGDDPHQDGAYLLRGGTGSLRLLHPERVPVDPRHRYRLRYRVQTVGVPEARGCEQAVVRVLQIDAGGRARALPAAWTAGKHGTSPWNERSSTFVVPAQAEAVQLQLVASAPRVGGADCEGGGEVWFDDVALEQLPDDAFAAHRGVSHPRLGVVTLSDRALSTAQDTRPAVHAPAPSRLSWTLEVPAAAVLELGMGLLRGAGPTGGSVRFSVAVRGPTGLHELAAHRVGAGTPSWVDARVDLGAYAGQRVELELRTEAGGSAQLSEAVDAAGLAVWSEPVLHTLEPTGEVVVLVVIDTLGAWAVGPGTPQLQRLAALGNNRTNAYSSASWTLPAVASMLTGQSPASHGAGAARSLGRSGRAALSPEVSTAVERLAALGWQTRAWVNNPFLAAEFGLAQGFDRYIDVGTRHRPGAGEPAVEAVVAWLSSPSSADRFVLLHLMEPHGPYRPTDAALQAIGRSDLRAAYPEGLSHEAFRGLSRGGVPEALREQVRALYAASVWDADRLVGQLYDALSAEIPTDRLRLIVTADHGEELWQHGGYEHGHAMHDEVVRVPWISLPATPRVDPTPVSTRLIAHELLGLSPPVGPVIGSSTLYGPQRAFVRTDAHVLVVNAALSPGGRAPAASSLAELWAFEGEDGTTARWGSFDAQAGAAWRTGHEALWPELVGALAGQHALIVPPTSPPRWQRVELSASLPDRSWPAGHTAIAWPGRGGEAGEVEVSRERGGRTVRAELAGGAVVFALRPPEGEHEVRWSVRVDGVVVEAVGASGDATAVEEALWVGLRAGGEARVVVLAGAAGGEARVGEETAEQLRGLGYVE
jgi:hypothetical protein